MESKKFKKSFSRRKVLISGGAAIAAPAILSITRAYAANPKLKVGFVSPKTGPLGGFAEADDYVVGAIQKVFSSGLSNNGKTYEVEIISKDSQSNPNRAAEVASDLIISLAYSFDDDISRLLLWVRFLEWFFQILF